MMAPMRWAYCAAGCAVALVMLNFLPAGWHRPWAIAWPLACGAFIVLLWRDGGGSRAKDSVRDARAVRVVRIALATAAVLSLLAYIATWTTGVTRCPPIANECYSQSFRSHEYVNPLLWTGYRPAGLTRVLLVAVSCGVLLLSRWRLRVAAILGLPLVLVAFALATAYGPLVSLTWTWLPDYQTSRVAPALGLGLAVAAVLATAVATLAAADTRPTSEEA